MWRGASAPTPFWSNTIEVEGEMIGRSWSDREGVASRRALFAHRTGCQRTSEASGRVSRSRVMIEGVFRDERHGRRCLEFRTLRYD